MRRIEIDVNDVPETRTSKSVIQESLPVVLTWVAAGYTLKSIHKKLEEQGVLSCSYSNFKKYYRIFKKEMGVSQSDTVAKKNVIGTSQLAASTPSVVPKAAIKAATQSLVSAEPTTAEIEPSGEPEKDESESNEPEQKKTESGLLGAFDLERNVALARIHFENNRNRYRKR